MARGRIWSMLFSRVLTNLSLQKFGTEGGKQIARLKKIDWKMLATVGNNLLLNESKLERLQGMDHDFYQVFVALVIKM